MKRDLNEIKKDNFMYQIEKQILLLHIDCDVVASPWDYDKTVEWYKKEYDTDEVEVSYVDIKHECMLEELSEDDSDYETLQYLYYLDDFRELIRGDIHEKKGNIVFFDGELHKYITFEDYCDRYLKSGKLMSIPEVIASTEI